MLLRGGRVCMRHRMKTSRGYFIQNPMLSVSLHLTRACLSALRLLGSSRLIRSWMLLASWLSAEGLQMEAAASTAGSETAGPPHEQRAFWPPWSTAARFAMARVDHRMSDLALRSINSTNPHQSVCTANPSQAWLNALCSVSTLIRLGILDINRDFHSFILALLLLFGIYVSQKR